MTTFIQLTDTDNDVLQTLPLGDISKSNITTYLFRVWNNLPQANGVETLDGLTLDLMYPPLQGITTLAKNDVIQIRCTYSGERSQSILTSFQSFPITHTNYDRLEPFTYNEYEIQIDFSVLSQLQKESIDLIVMSFNIIATYDKQYAPFFLPKEYSILSNTSIDRTPPTILLLSDTFIFALQTNSIISDTRIKNSFTNILLTDTSILNLLTILEVESNSAIHRVGYQDIQALSDARIKRLGFTPINPILSHTTIKIRSYQMNILSGARVVTILGSAINMFSDVGILVEANELIVDANSRIFILAQEAVHDPLGDALPFLSDSRIKILGVNADRLEIESNTLIV